MNTSTLGISKKTFEASLPIDYRMLVASRMHPSFEHSIKKETSFRFVETGEITWDIGMLFVPDDPDTKGIWIGRMEHGREVLDFIRAIPTSLFRQGTMHLCGLGQDSLLESEGPNITKERQKLHTMIHVLMPEENIHVHWTEDHAFTNVIFDWKTSHVFVSRHDVR